MDKVVTAAYYEGKIIFVTERGKIFELRRSSLTEKYEIRRVAELGAADLEH